MAETFIPLDELEFDSDTFIPLDDIEWQEDSLGETAEKVGTNIGAKWESATGGFLESMGDTESRLSSSYETLNRNKPDDESWSHYVGTNAAALGDALVAGGQQALKDLYQIFTGTESSPAEIDAGLKEIGSEIRRDAQQTLKDNQYNLEDGSPLYWGANIADALIGDLGPTVATAAVAGPTAGLSLMGAKVYGSTYSEEIEKGKTPVEAGQSAAFKSIAEAVSEKIPLDAIMKYGKAGLSGVLKKAGVSWLDEGGQEVLVGFINEAYDSGIVPKDTDLKTFLEAMTSDERLGEAWKEFVIGGASGSLASISYDAATGSWRKEDPNGAARLLQERINAQLRQAQADMEVATTAESVVAAAQSMVNAPLDTFELDNFHAQLTEQGLLRQAEIDNLGITEGPFVSTKLWKQTPQSGTTVQPVTAEQQKAFETYDALPEQEKAYIPEPLGFRDWKAALAQVADQEVQSSIQAEEATDRVFQYLERDVGAILDNEEVGPEVRNDQLKRALEDAKAALRDTKPPPPPDDTGSGGGGVAAVKSPESTPPVTVYGSGANGRADFAAQQAAGMRSGVEAPRVTGPMVEEIARSETPVFVDSGAFGAFRKGETVDFDKVYQTYESIDAKSETPNMRFVAPDVVGDQDATLSLQKQYADRTKKLVARGHEVLVPIQLGKLRPRQVVEKVRGLLGPNVTIAVPSNESAFTENDLRDLMRARPKKIHFLGVAANKAKLEKLSRIARAFVPDVEISADGNRIRAVADEKLSADTKARKDELAQDGVNTGAGPAGRYDETEGIAEFLDNPDSVPASQLKAFVEQLSPVLPPNTTAARLMKAEKTKPGSFRQLIEEADEDGLYTMEAYRKAVQPHAERAAAGTARKEAVAQRLKDKPVFKRAGKPLDKIRVTTQATVAETGETVEIDQRADLALREIDNRIGALQQLLGCIG